MNFSVLFASLTELHCIMLDFIQFFLRMKILTKFLNRPIAKIEHFDNFANLFHSDARMFLWFPTSVLTIEEFNYRLSSLFFL